MKKSIAGGLVSLLVAAGLAFAGTGAASATNNDCTPADAWDEKVVTQPYVAAVPGTPEILEESHTDYQRYSWVGGPSEEAPTELPPSDNWQANTTNYEGAGHGTDPIGVSFQGNGKGDWFFWTGTKVVTQPYVAAVPGTPEILEVSHTVHHDAVTCEKQYPPVIVPVSPFAATAPDCDTDGTYALPEGPAAQNHNPAAGLYGVELNGYHLYVKNTTGEFGGPGEYKWDAYGIGANGNAAYPLGTSVGGKVDSHGNPKAGGKVSGSFTVAAATGDCPVVVPAASCVSAGEWYTEGDDLTPIATPEGLVFNGGSGKAVGYRLPVTGNLQGWTSVSFDATGGTEQFFFRIVIDASADGGPAYKSLSFPGYTTIDQNSVSYQYGETLAETALRFPNNQLLSAGFQTNSGAPEGYSATLRSVTGDCGSVNWTYEVPEQPDDRVVTTSVDTTDCETDTVTTATTTATYPTTYDAESNTWVEGEGVVTVASSQREATDVECPVTPVDPVDPEEPATPDTDEEETPDWGNRAAAVDAEELAVTGGTPWIAGGIAGALAVVAGSVLFAVRRRTAAE